MSDGEQEGISGDEEPRRVSEDNNSNEIRMCLVNVTGLEPCVRFMSMKRYVLMEHQGKRKIEVRIFKGLFQIFPTPLNYERKYGSSVFPMWVFGSW